MHGILMYKMFGITDEENKFLNFRLEIKQAAEGTQDVPGLIEARVYGTEDVWEMLKTGNQVRSVGSTCANELSSRSHWYS